jgi:hypothetical protein
MKLKNPIVLLSAEECAHILAGGDMVNGELSNLTRNNLLLARMVGLVRAFMDNDPDRRERYGLALLELLAHFPSSGSLRWGEESQKPPPERKSCPICRRTIRLKDGRMVDHFYDPGVSPRRWCDGSEK